MYWHVKISAITTAPYDKLNIRAERNRISTAISLKRNFQQEKCIRDFESLPLSILKTRTDQLACIWCIERQAPLKRTLSRISENVFFALKT